MVSQKSLVKFQSVTRCDKAHRKSEMIIKLNRVTQLCLVNKSRGYLPLMLHKFVVKLHGETCFTVRLVYLI